MSICKEAHVDECICVEKRCFVESQCKPSPLCRNSTTHEDVQNTHIVIPVVCGDVTSCEHQKTIVRRLLLSLLAVNTTLPVHVMTPNTTDFRRFPHVISRANPVAPRWAAPYHTTSFYKLEALRLVQYEKIVVLDTDVQVVRNIDHLARVPTPAFVVHRPDRGINSGLQVIRPSLHAYRSAQHIMSARVTKRYDGGDQEVLRKLYPTFFELPLKYNARPHFTPVQQHLCDTFVLHNYDARKHLSTVSKPLYLNECA